MNRLDRRLAILRGKREGAFDTDQYYLERARRTRISRQVRNRLRRMEPVALVTPRWSQPQRFLDDVATDLLLGEPAVTCRTLNLLPLHGRTQHQAWAWLVQAITELCGLTLDGPAWQAVSRLGFRTVVRSLLARAEASGTRRCLMIHGMEHCQVDALHDLIEIFDDHVRSTGRKRRFNLLLAGAIESPGFVFAGAEPVTLPDFSEMEAVEVLVEHLGPLEAHRLRSVVALVGGVPAMLDALGSEPEGRLSEIMQDREAVWRVLGHLALEIRSAFDIVAADSDLMQRLELIAREGPLPEEPEQDARLVRAGLVDTKPSKVGRGKLSDLRAPVFADLALAS